MTPIRNYLLHPRPDPLLHSLTRPSHRPAAVTLARKIPTATTAIAPFSLSAHTSAFRKTTDTSARNVPPDNDSSSGDAGQPQHWKYDLSFKTQIGKAALFTVLGMAGAVEGWTWYRETRRWWRGVGDGDDGEEI
ncbi:hypothetical protein BO70DRAFT_144643 [Aspergillus heteromorphus CBS 117.55]|uniref:Uncharacterized protein n=1 Tax=Aspergillus heteromorphus CBS 117.55 TaxID=1448321 RepID=A0A317VCV4_9EURO|nr:uncharacterized protein BO70DRAFT_144643 [Aspergillus heteromorphus CBS 117.55]PWY69700.1 hypothetical protein BO70DRAFT_144643 [Aspergillus heteromorphus CBS 117.55]